MTATPDQAQIDIGVTTQERSAKDAARRNAEQLDRVMAEVRRAAGADAKIQTINYSLRPDFRPVDNRKPEIAGYTATNVIRVTLRDLERVSDVIDAGTRSGANEIRRLQFGLHDPDAVQAQALRTAAEKAQAKASALAAALGVTIVRVLSAAESGPPAMPAREVMFAARADLATPIEPGTIEVSATVTLTVEVSQPVK